ncbi:hypothetical protein [Chryseobacterium sp. SIMBA_028]|uniref:hypothetical protein n=1 Tax=Chryseobacterium sp. SIMBA_028 TaxID=3085771 RepID=UPI00397CF1AF
MKTLQLFNAVLAKKTDEKPFISNDGFIIEPDALWAVCLQKKMDFLLGSVC